MIGYAPPPERSLRYTRGSIAATGRTPRGIGVGAMEDQQGRGAETAVGLAVVAARPSLLPALDRIAELAKLPAGWDREDAEPATAGSVAAACYLIEAVAETQERRGFGRVSPATSSPIPDGGLQVEWEGADARVDVQANPDGSYGFLAKWGAGAGARYEEADEAPLSTILALIDRALGS